jgi:hypothetical protein
MDDKDREYEKLSKHELYMLAKYYETRAEVFAELLEKLMKEKTHDQRRVPGVSSCVL